MKRTRHKHRGVRVVECKLLRYGVIGLHYSGLNLIEIDPRQRSRQYLNTLVHELLHHVCPSKGELWVRRAAGTLSRVIWDQGFRKLSK